MGLPHTTEQSSALCCSWLKVLNQACIGCEQLEPHPICSPQSLWLILFVCIHFHGKHRSIFILCTAMLHEDCPLSWLGHFIDHSTLSHPHGLQPVSHTQQCLCWDPGIDLEGGAAQGRGQKSDRHLWDRLHVSFCHLGPPCDACCTFLYKNTIMVTGVSGETQRM